MINLKDWIHKENSKYIISIILGLGLAALFRKACKDGDCLHFESQPIKDLTNGNVYKYGNECYNYNISTQKLPVHLVRGFLHTSPRNIKFVGKFRKLWPKGDSLEDKSVLRNTSSR